MKAAFYPSLSIDAAVGYGSFNAAHLVATPESFFYGFYRVDGGPARDLVYRKLHVCSKAEAVSLALNRA